MQKLSGGKMKKLKKKGIINDKIKWYLPYNYSIMKIFTQQYQNDFFHNGKIFCLFFK